MATLEANLPAPHLVAEVQAGLLVDSAAYIVETAVGVVEGALTVPACAATLDHDIIAVFSSATNDLASIRAAVDGSVQVVGATD